MREPCASGPSTRTPSLFAAASRLYTGCGSPNTTGPWPTSSSRTSRDPDFPLYLGGSRLLGVFPLGPVMEGMGLNITVMSSEDVLYWGLASDARAVPRLWDMAAAVPRALAELMDAAGLEPEPLDIPLHLGPGMPPTARWTGVAGGEHDAGSVSP